MASKINYKIKSQIGKGGMSTVYLAHDTQLNRDVAIKVLKIDPRLGLGEAGLQEIVLRFQQEAQAAARLNHPNIVSIYQVGQQGNQHYIVMEYLEGSSFAQLIKSGERYPLQTVTHWMSQVCDGLDFAHEHGIVHRDIKPDNLILLKNGTVKITDFGIARLDESELVKTKDQTFMGTIYYCSPEQLKGFKDIDRRADIFSTGVVFYELLAGFLPFRANSIAETINKIMTDDPLPLQRINPEVPAKLERVILKALEKKAENRFSTAREMKRALDDTTVSSKAAPKPSGRQDVLSQKASTGSFFKLSAIVGLILMVAALLFGYFIIDSEMKILQKDASFRGQHIAQMFSLLVNDANIGSNQELLKKYLAEIGTDSNVVFIEMMKGNQVVMGYHAERPTPEEDIFLKSYPLADSGALKIGFSNESMNRKIKNVKWGIGVAFAVIGVFLIVALAISRMRSPVKWKV